MRRQAAGSDMKAKAEADGVFECARHVPLSQSLQADSNAKCILFVTSEEIF